MRDTNETPTWPAKSRALLRAEERYQAAVGAYDEAQKLRPHPKDLGDATPHKEVREQRDKMARARVATEKELRAASKELRDVHTAWLTSTFRPEVGRSYNAHRAKAIELVREVLSGYERLEPAMRVADDNQGYPWSPRYRDELEIVRAFARRFGIA